MVISIQMPYFIPYPGYFLPIMGSDIFVILDWVQFPQGRSWVSRNLVKTPQGKLWLSVPVKRKGLGLQDISDVKILKEGNWQKKFISTIETAYYNAPYLSDHIDFLKETFLNVPDRLIDLNVILLRYLISQFGIKRELIHQSHLGIKVKEPQLSFLIAKELGANALTCLSHKRKYLDESAFEREGIEVSYLRYEPVVYPQLWGEFIPNLSCLDLLLNCGPRSKEVLGRRLRA